MIDSLVEITADGSPTLRHPLFGDAYHSLKGAEGESTHVFIEQGMRHCSGEQLRILEVGFGSGLNAWLTLVECEQSGRSVDYTAVELYPVSIDTARNLKYCADSRFEALHSTPWEQWNEVTPTFRLKKIETDLVYTSFDTIFDLVYFDAFAPDTQPQLWSEAIFVEIYRCMAVGGVLVTYCSKGDAKRALRAAGFKVKRVEGALGKHHMLRATKQ